MQICIEGCTDGDVAAISNYVHSLCHDYSNLRITVSVGGNDDSSDDDNDNTAQLISKVRSAWIDNPSEDAQSEVFAEVRLIGDMLSVINKVRTPHERCAADTVINKLSGICLSLRRQCDMPAIEDEQLKSTISLVEEIIATHFNEPMEILHCIRNQS